MNTSMDFMVEPFVSANAAAKFLSIDRRLLLSLARAEALLEPIRSEQGQAQNLGVSAIGTRGFHCTE